jgi:hypothetical protein
MEGNLWEKNDGIVSEIMEMTEDDVFNTTHAKP